jgi:fucose permease
MRAWHLSITSFFAFFGLAWASWVVRLPELKSLMNISTAELGLLLLIGSIGSLSSLITSNRFIERFATKRSLQAGASLFLVSLVSAVFFAAAHLPIATAFCLFFVGFGVGLADVAQNVDGSQIEQKLERSVMPRLHAAFSFGTLAGAGYGTIGAAVRLDVAWQTFALLPVGVLLLFITSRHLPADTGLVVETKAEANAAPVEKRANAFKALFGSPLILLGLGIFAITIVEGASNDWLALSLVDNYGASDANAGIGYGVLVGTMAVTRFFGGQLVDLWGRERVIRRAALIGVVGILTIVLGPTLFGGAALYFAWIASGLWGIGVAMAFPLFLSAAGEGEDSARQVALVATCGYVAFLVGPPSLGFLGQAIGLLNMFYVLAACLLVAAFLARALRPASGAAAAAAASLATND